MEINIDNLSHPAKSLLDHLCYYWEMTPQKALDRILVGRLARMIKQERRFDFATYPEFAPVEGQQLDGWDLLWWLADGKKPTPKDNSNDAPDHLETDS